MTGFGLKGHAKNLAEAQVNSVDLVFDAVPIIAGMHQHIDGMRDFKVRSGVSAETSGGLLVMLGA